jgi:hypothetical protein
MKFLVALFMLVSLVGCGPSCEEQGGVMVYTGTILMPMKMGSVTIMQQYPQYACRMPEMEIR